MTNTYPEKGEEADLFKVDPFADTTTRERVRGFEEGY